MSAGRPLMTGLVALILATIGFAAGGFGSAWQTREAVIEPWRKLRIEHVGLLGVSTRTRVIFLNPKLPLQAVEVVRNPDGDPELARVALKDGEELTVRYKDGVRPTSLESVDGSRAEFKYKGAKATVTFVSADGTEKEKTVTVPTLLRPALGMANAGDALQLDSGDPDLLPRHADADDAIDAAIGALVLGIAHAQESEAPEEDRAITVKRDATIELDVSEKTATSAAPGEVQLEANCPPFTCLPVDNKVPMPGESKVIISVSSSIEQSKLDKPSRDSQLDNFIDEASKERRVAQRVMPDAAAVVALVGVTANACKSAKISWPICVKDLRKSSTSSAGATLSVTQHEVDLDGGIVKSRAEVLYFEDRARQKLDEEVTIELCGSRDGYARTCTKIKGRPFDDSPIEASKSLEMSKGIGGTLAGSYVLTQSDGADCKFSPSPKTSGPLKLTFDNVRFTVTASFSADVRGTRANLGCSLGTANMAWSQNYTVSASQTFTAEQFQASGKLPLKLTGTMNGRGSFTFSNCRSSGGASANCPAGKSEGYSYPIEINGSVDTNTQVGSGNIVVRNAPLSTGGSWQTPAGEGTP